jgi:hypothetical protein
MSGPADFRRPAQQGESAAGSPPRGVRRASKDFLAGAADSPRRIPRLAGVLFKGLRAGL